METKGKKFDSEKPDLSLLPKEPLWEIATVLTKGANKYGRYNWMEGIEISRLLAASMRHITQFNDGEDRDPELQTVHLANACCNLMFAMWMLQHRPDLDNRRKSNEQK